MAKRHNWVTGPNHKVVDRKANRIATAFIDSCGHLTPAKQAELDALLAEIAVPERLADGVCEPDQDVLDAMEAAPELELEPPPEAYEYDNNASETDETDPEMEILKARSAFEA